MRKPRLLDLFCGEGGSAMGYCWAGFEDITGVDLFPMPRYPFRFVQADALDFLMAHGHEYDFIHASPPCQLFSVATPEWARANHLDLIAPTRSLLWQLGKPYIIENVGGARKKLLDPIMLCGSQFGLKVYRHRFFESNLHLISPRHYPHHDNLQGNCMISENGFTGVYGHFSNKEYAKYAMGIDWMTPDGLAEAIPPAYTEYLGYQVLDQMESDSSIFYERFRATHTNLTIDINK